MYILKRDSFDMSSTNKAKNDLTSPGEHPTHTHVLQEDESRMKLLSQPPAYVLGARRHDIELVVNVSFVSHPACSKVPRSILPRHLALALVPALCSNRCVIPVLP